MAGWNSWENIVDEVVYQKNGLRLPGSHKSERCSVCKNDKVEVKNCVQCGRKGYLDMGRVYNPYMFIRQTGEKAPKKLANLKENTYQMVSYTCIRLPNPPKCPTWKRPEGAPIPANLHSVRKPISGTTGSAKKKGFSEDQQGMRKFPKQEIEPDSPIFLKLEKFLQENINAKLYGRIQINKLHKKENQRCHSYIATTKGYGSHTCLNKKDLVEHSHNTIYFVITKRGVQQRCFCCCTGPDVLASRVRGLCRDFKSDLYPLSQEICKLLFKKSCYSGLNTGMNTEFVDYKSNPMGYQLALKQLLEHKHTSLWKNDNRSPDGPNVSSHSRQGNAPAFQQLLRATSARNASIGDDNRMSSSGEELFSDDYSQSSSQFGGSPSSNTTSSQAESMLNERGCPCNKCHTLLYFDSEFQKKLQYTNEEITEQFKRLTKKQLLKDMQRNDYSCVSCVLFDEDDDI